jgi:hypothetical protein
MYNQNPNFNQNLDYFRNYPPPSMLPHPMTPQVPPPLYQQAYLAANGAANNDNGNDLQVTQYSSLVAAFQNPPSQTEVFASASALSINGWNFENVWLEIPNTNQFQRFDDQLFPPLQNYEPQFQRFEPQFQRFDDQLSPPPQNYEPQFPRYQPQAQFYNNQPQQYQNFRGPSQNYRGLPRQNYFASSQRAGTSSQRAGTSSQQNNHASFQQNFGLPLQQSFEDRSYQAFLRQMQQIIAASQRYRARQQQITNPWQQRVVPALTNNNNNNNSETLNLQRDLALQQRELPAANPIQIPETVRGEAEEGANIFIRDKSVGEIMELPVQKHFCLNKVTCQQCFNAKMKLIAHPFPPKPLEDNYGEYGVFSADLEFLNHCAPVDLQFGDFECIQTASDNAPPKVSSATTFKSLLKTLLKLAADQAAAIEMPVEGPVEEGVFSIHDQPTTTLSSNRFVQELISCIQRKEEQMEQKLQEPIEPPQYIQQQPIQPPQHLQQQEQPPRIVSRFIIF